MIIPLGSTKRNAPGPHSSWHLGAISEFQIKEEHCPLSVTVGTGWGLAEAHPRWNGGDY